MQDFAKFEEPEGEWCFKPSPEVEFSVLKTLNFCSWVRDKAEIAIRIETTQGAEKPSETQVETLKFILENQNEIVKSIFDFNQRFIYPIFKASIDIEEDETVTSLSELSRVYGIRCIELPNLNEINSFYYLILFDFKYDEEHGLYLLFRDTSVIDFFAEGDKDLGAIDMYRNGLKNTSEEPLEISLYKVPAQSVLQTTCRFDEEIEFPLDQGAYRVSVVCNQTKYGINFYASNNFERFSLKQALVMGTGSFPS